jgi:NitT/TauT family transport system ATP-binding protein
MPETMSALTPVGDPRATPYIEVDHLYLGYPGESRGDPVVACHDLNFAIGRGEFVVLVGPSGCGKTTFLESLAGLGHVGAGELRIDGKPVTGPGRDRSLVFQSPSLFPWRDVYGNVIFGVQAQGRLDEEAKRRARAIIEMVGLSHVSRWRPRELSGGMRQRVNLARALLTEPRLLLLDEPFGALDAQTREVLQDELVRIWQESALSRSTTAIFVTHDVGEAVLLADRVIVFSKPPGRVLADIRVDLPRPRVRRSQPVTHYEERILAALYGRQREAGSDGDPAAGTGAPVGLGDEAS